MNEVERKYRLPDDEFNRILRAIQSVGPTVRQSDRVYLQNLTSFAQTDKKEGYAVLRVRTCQGKTTITAKRRRSDQSAIEAEIDTDHNTAAAFMDALRWNLVTEVSKSRREASVNGVTVAFDEVDSLGKFIELEVLVTEEGEVPAALIAINGVASSLGLVDSWIETLKYDELLTRAT